MKVILMITTTIISVFLIRLLLMGGLAKLLSFDSQRTEVYKDTDITHYQWYIGKNAKKEYADKWGMDESIFPESITDKDRMTTGIAELDRVLGGGVVEGSLVLVGGDPGIGKSTLLLQMCNNMASDNRKVLYISGEESLKQIKIRAERLGNNNESMLLLCETNLEVIEQVLKEEKPDIVIIDSIQTMYREEISSAPGSVSQG